MIGALYIMNVGEGEGEKSCISIGGDHGRSIVGASGSE